MKQLLTAAFTIDGRTFIELPEPVTKIAQTREGQLFSATVEPDGRIILSRKEEKP